MNSELVGSLAPELIVRAAAEHGTPLYLYDRNAIVARCRQILAMPNAYGLHASYAMKANSGRAVLQTIVGTGFGVDASSLNEARRARLAGVEARSITLTTQEVPLGADRQELESLMDQGMLYNACSLRQLELILPFAVAKGHAISVRVNPGKGTGESVTRNTGDKYSSFGVHLDLLPSLVQTARAKGLRIAQVHVHIGSGGDPSAWRDNIDRILTITEEHFPDAHTVNLGGGFKEARMPDEKAADIQSLGAYAKLRFEEFAARTGRKLKMAVEPGTFIVANAGYLVTTVVDKKSSGPDGFEFLLLDAGMEANTRPLLYGSRHPFYVVSRAGRLLSSEFSPSVAQEAARVVCGRCCESGDSQTLDDSGAIVPRPMADPEVGDHFVIGGAGAYCSSMSLVNYNSYLQAPEVMAMQDGGLVLVRRRQSLEQIVNNEVGLNCIPGLKQ